MDDNEVFDGWRRIENRVSEPFFFKCLFRVVGTVDNLVGCGGGEQSEIDNR